MGRPRLWPRPGAARATMPTLPAPGPQADGPTPGGCQPEPGQTDPADLRPESMRPSGPPLAPNRQGSGVAGHRESTGLHVTLCGRLAAICQTMSAVLARGSGRFWATPGSTELGDRGDCGSSAGSAVLGEVAVPTRAAGVREGPGAPG